LILYLQQPPAPPTAGLFVLFLLAHKDMLERDNVFLVGNGIHKRAQLMLPATPRTEFELFLAIDLLRKSFNKFHDSPDIF